MGSSDPLTSLAMVQSRIHQHSAHLLFALIMNSPYFVATNCDPLAFSPSTPIPNILVSSSANLLHFSP